MVVSIAPGRASGEHTALAINVRFTVTPMSLDGNRERTYKNKQRTPELQMRVFLKDAMALVAIVGFTGATLAWVDMASRLV
jgi:hypothetical protein